MAIRVKLTIEVNLLREESDFNDDKKIIDLYKNGIFELHRKGNKEIIEQLAKEFCNTYEVKRIKKLEKYYNGFYPLRDFPKIEPLSEIPDAKDCKPLAPEIKVVEVYIPSIPQPLRLSVTFWEKLWYIATNYGKMIDAIIKALPLIIPLITLLQWLSELRNKIRRNK